MDVFDDTPTTLAVNGYSTSFQWPAVLRRKLDRYDEGVVAVEEATKGGAPVVKWMNVDRGEPAEPWEELLQPVLDAPGRVVVLAQQSLQWAYGEREVGIRDVTDVERIRRGADAFEAYADLLLAEGADHVFIATHIYKHPMEPEIGNERFALAALLDRDRPSVAPGPDVWTPTRDAYPEAFADDGVHPNERGAEVLAHYWFARLCDAAGREVPAWSRAELEEAMA